MTTLFVSLNGMLADKSTEFILYISDIPPASIQYPYYHPNRSRFFNTATLFQQSAESLIQSTKDYLQENWNIRRKSINSNNLAYNNYVNWEKSGGKDFQLPGFFLTNRQMFWVALAHKKYYKFHSHNNKDISRSHFQFQYFHLSFKNIKHFRESFNCSNMTADENKMYKDFKKESLILNQNKNKMD